MFSGPPSSAASRPEPARPAGLGRWFHTGLAGFLLLAVGIGFAPSFFLRPYFTSRPLPAYLWLHGVLLTLWFGLLFTQSGLVAARRIQWHRRLGAAALAVATLLVPVSIFVAVRAIPRYIAAGVSSDEIQFIVIGDIMSMAIFAPLIALAATWRRDKEWHKRLVAAASILIIGPAVARWERAGIAVPVPAVILGLLFALGLHDFVQHGRVHRATLASSLAIALTLGMLLLLVGTPTGERIIESLGRL